MTIMMQRPYEPGQEGDNIGRAITDFDALAAHTEAIRRKCVAQFGIGGFVHSGKPLMTPPILACFLMNDRNCVCSRLHRGVLWGPKSFDNYCHGSKTK